MLKYYKNVKNFHEIFELTLFKLKENYKNNIEK